MTAKLERLNTPSAIQELREYYKENNILECAEHFCTSHETIRRILRANNIRIRQRGEFTDRTRILTTAHRCANEIRKTDKSLHKSIIKEILNIYGYKVYMSILEKTTNTLRKE